MKRILGVLSLLALVACTAPTERALSPSHSRSNNLIAASLPVPNLVSVQIVPNAQDSTQLDALYSFDPYTFPDGVMGAHFHADGTDETGRHVLGLDVYDPAAFAAGELRIPLDPIHGTDVTCVIEANANALADGTALYARSNAVVLSQAVIQAALQSAKKGHGHK